jgi:maltoporin
MWVPALRVKTRGVIIRVLSGKCCAFGLLLFGCFLPFKVNPGGELEFGVSYIDKPDSSGANNGWAITAQHKQQDFFGGVNTFALQYGRGPGTGLGCTGDVNLDRDNKSWRLVEYFDWQATPRLGGQVQFVYQKDTRPEGSTQLTRTLSSKLIPS